MTTDISVKKCLTCNKPLKGRTDKKFCDDYCRNGYNNQLKAGDNNFVRNINNTLRKNRRILEALLPINEEMAKANKDKLLHKEFQFKYGNYIFVGTRSKIKEGRIKIQPE